MKHLFLFNPHAGTGSKQVAVRAEVDRAFYGEDLLWLPPPTQDMQRSLPMQPARPERLSAFTPAAATAR